MDRIKASKRLTPIPIFELFEMIARNIFPEVKGESIYIPAGRAGLLESYDTVASALISLSPVAPIRGISMPPLPGMASQFYDIMLRLRGEDGPFKDVAESFKDLFAGDILLSQVPEPKGKTKIVYKFSSDDKEHIIDVIHSASMIKELAPLYLIIREVVEPSSFLIIEEPEAHLHPAAQCKLVNIIANLVNGGVYVLFTTHSDLLLRKVLHLVSPLGKEKGIITPENLAVYFLKEEKGGSIIERVEIPKYGILEKLPTFDEVIKELYDEEMLLFKKQMEE
jgi:predicted ATPase